jgi:hypothetical protein
MPGRNLSRAFLGLTWLALAVAFAGAVSTPRNYCYFPGASIPAAEIVVVAALAAALAMQLAAIVVATTAPEWTLREALIDTVSTVAALIAAIAVVWLWQQHVHTWGCG